jgi:hypothetical protein
MGSKFRYDRPFDSARIHRHCVLGQLRVHASGSHAAAKWHPMCSVVVQRDRLVREYSEHVAARPSLGPREQGPAELEEVMQALGELETIGREVSVVHGLEQRCMAVAMAEQELEAKQAALRMLVGAQPAPAHALAELVTERDAFRQACKAQRSLLLAATSAEELGRLCRLWEARLQRIQTSLDLSLSVWTVPPAPELDGLTELELLRRTSDAASAAIAQRSDAIRERLSSAQQTTDSTARRLAEELSLTSSHLKFLCDGRSEGLAPAVSDLSTPDLSDELLTAIEVERATWAKVELERPFPSDRIVAFGQALRELCEGSVSSMHGVQLALSSALQAAECESALCSSMEASERVASLAVLRKEEQRKRKEYRRAKEDFDEGEAADDGAATRLAETRLELSRVREKLRSSTVELANLAYSTFPELLAGIHGPILLPSLDFGGLLREGVNLDDFDELCVLPSASRHPIWTATEDHKKFVLKGYLLAEAGARACFSRELRALRRLQHPTIVELLGVFIDPKGWAYVQMPFYQCTLAEWAVNAERSQLLLQQVLMEVSRALEHVHNHAIIHGDVKPENIFMEMLNEHLRPRLGDFDLSQDASGRSLLLSRAASTAPGATGTLVYMAPELLAGQPATFASDVYSLGKTVFFVHFPMLLGAGLPSTGEVSIPPHANAELVQLLKQMLAAEPSKRPTAAQAASAAYFTTSLLAEKEAAAALMEVLHVELACARSAQQKLQEERQAFVERQRAFESADKQLREEQAAFSELSNERKAQLAGQAQTLKEREAQLQQARLHLSGERAKLQDERKRQADAEAVLSEKQRKLRDSAALFQKPPLYWSCASTASPFSEHNVTSEMRSRMQGMVDQSCTVFGVGRDLKTRWPPYTGLRVKSVLRIENSALWSLYSAQRTFVRQNSQHAAKKPVRVACYDNWMRENALWSDCNELYLFHGTESAAVPLIKKQGFETRLPKKSGRMLGDGVYFAENASKSDQYGVPTGQTFYLFVARVCLGAAYMTVSPQSDLKRPPETSAGGRLFDSLLYDSGNKHREFVVYDRTACYPEFLIEYERV